MLLFIHTVRNHHSIADSLVDSTELFRNIAHSGRYDTILFNLIDISEDERDTLMIRERDMKELQTQLANKNNLDVVNFSLGLGLETMIRIQQEAITTLIILHKEAK